MSYLNRVGTDHAKRVLVRAGIAEDLWRVCIDGERTLSVGLLDGGFYKFDKPDSERLFAANDGVTFLGVMSELVLRRAVPDRVIHGLHYDFEVPIYNFWTEPDNAAMVVQLDMSYEFHPLLRFEGVTGVNWYDPADVLRVVAERTSNGFALSGAIDHLWARVGSLDPSDSSRADLAFYHYMTQEADESWKREISHFTFTTEDAVQVLVALYGMIDRLMTEFSHYLEQH